MRRRYRYCTRVSLTFIHILHLHECQRTNEKACFHYSAKLMSKYFLKKVSKNSDPFTYWLLLDNCIWCRRYLQQYFNNYYVVLNLLPVYLNLFNYQKYKKPRISVVPSFKDDSISPIHGEPPLIDRPSSAISTTSIVITIVRRRTTSCIAYTHLITTLSNIHL